MGGKGQDRGFGIDRGLGEDRPSGTDRGVGTDHGNGSDPENGGGKTSMKLKGPRLCVKGDPCEGGVCAADKLPGFCTAVCDGGAVCPYGECAKGADNSVCLLPCSSPEQCPNIDGLEALCTLITKDKMTTDNANKYCVWISPSPP
ncbi:MAG: hypothetical protein NVS3B20_15010 [Polyangiales bacterium]